MAFTLNTEGISLRQFQGTVTYQYGLGVGTVTHTNPDEYCMIGSVGVYSQTEPPMGILCPVGGSVTANILATIVGSPGGFQDDMMFNINGQLTDITGATLEVAFSASGTYSVSGQVSVADWIDVELGNNNNTMTLQGNGTVSIVDSLDEFSSITMVAEAVLGTGSGTIEIRWYDNGVIFNTTDVTWSATLYSTVNYHSSSSGIHTIHVGFFLYAGGFYTPEGYTPDAIIRVVESPTGVITTENQIVSGNRGGAIYANTGQNIVYTASVSGGVVNEETYRYQWYHKNNTSQTQGQLIAGQVSSDLNFAFTPETVGTFDATGTFVVYAVVQDDVNNVVLPSVQVIVSTEFSASMTTTPQFALPGSTVTAIVTHSGGHVGGVNNPVNWWSAVSTVAGDLLIGTVAYYYQLFPPLQSSNVSNANRIESFVESYVFAGGNVVNGTINVVSGPTTTYELYLRQNGTLTALGTQTGTVTPPYTTNFVTSWPVEYGDTIDWMLKTGTFSGQATVKARFDTAIQYADTEILWYVDGSLQASDYNLGTISYVLTGGTHTFEARVYNDVPNQWVSTGTFSVGGTLTVDLIPSQTNQYFVGNILSFVGTVAPSSISGDSIVWNWLNGVATLASSTTNATTSTLSSTLSAGIYNIQVQAIDATLGSISGISSVDSFVVGHQYAATIQGTVSVINSGETVTDYAFTGLGTTNAGNIGTANVFTTLWWSGTVMSTVAAFNNDCVRSISKASEYVFDVNRNIGSVMALGDQIEFGYKGNQVFLGWIYSIDKKDEMKYTITAYDGIYGLAQSTYFSDISRDNATLGISDLLKAMALQVSTKNGTRLGVNTISAGTVPQKFGYKFSEGQALQKLEALALGYGYVFLTDSKNNLYVESGVPSPFQGYDDAGGYLVFPSFVKLVENTNGLIMQSKEYNPAIKYGQWTVQGTEKNGVIKSGISGSGIPSRTLGGDWLLIQDSDVGALGTVSANYNQTFQNGLWVVKMWTKNFYDPYASLKTKYTIGFQDGTILRRLVLTDSEISQSGNVVTFKGSGNGRSENFGNGIVDTPDVYVSGQSSTAGPYPQNAVGSIVGGKYVWPWEWQYPQSWLRAWSELSTTGATIGTGVLEGLSATLNILPGASGTTVATVGGTLQIAIYLNGTITPLLASGSFSTVGEVGTISATLSVSDMSHFVFVGSNDLVGVGMQFTSDNTFYTGLVYVSTVIAAVFTDGFIPADDTNLSLWNVAVSSGP